MRRGDSAAPAAAAVVVVAVVVVSSACVVVVQYGEKRHHHTDGGGGGDDIDDAGELGQDYSTPAAAAASCETRVTASVVAHLQHSITSVRVYFVLHRNNRRVSEL